VEEDEEEEEQEKEEKEEEEEGELGTWKEALPGLGMWFRIGI